MDKTPENWVNIDTVAKHLAVHSDTIRSWIKKGTIPYYRAGKQYKFRISEVDAWLTSGEGARAAEGEEE